MATPTFDESGNMTEFYVAARRSVWNDLFMPMPLSMGISIGGALAIAGFCIRNPQPYADAAATMVGACLGAAVAIAGSFYIWERQERNRKRFGIETVIGIMRPLHGTALKFKAISEDRSDLPEGEVLHNFLIGVPKCVDELRDRCAAFDRVAEAMLPAAAAWGAEHALGLIEVGSAVQRLSSAIPNQTDALEDLPDLIAGTGKVHKSTDDLIIALEGAAARFGRSFAD